MVRPGCSWGLVRTLGIIFFVANILGILGLLVLIIGAVEAVYIGEYLNLVSPGYGNFLTAMIVIAGLLCAPTYFLGVHLCLSLAAATKRVDEVEEEEDVNPEETNRWLLRHTLGCLASGVAVAILNVVCLARSRSFDRQTRDGLIEAIENYSSDLLVKARIDSLQTDLECCGAEDHRDWFRVPWLSSEQGGLTEEPDLQATEDVPFSCCSIEAAELCLHHRASRDTYRGAEHPENLGISKTGCRSKILSRGQTLRYSLAGYLIFLFAHQILLALLSRLLQTAHSNAMYLGPLKSHYRLWIFCGPPACGPFETTGVHKKAPQVAPPAPNSPPSSTDGTVETLPLSRSQGPSTWKESENGEDVSEIR